MSINKTISIAVVLGVALFATTASANWSKQLSWPSSNQKWHNPLDAASIFTDDSAFYESPSYPAVNGNNKAGHAGLDIKASAGSLVRAIAPGNIIAVKNSGRADTSYVIVLHRTNASYNNRFCAIYGHVDSSLSATTGQNGVQKGQTLGTVMSGSNLGYNWTDHLHFGINVDKRSAMCNGRIMSIDGGDLGWGRGPKDTDYDRYGFRDPLVFLSQNKSRY